jgi:hypothetical protein
MMSAKATKIKQKKVPNDVFITPLPLAKKAIDMIDVIQGEIWYDPFKNSGSYYNQFPDGNEKKYTEILENKDFFDFDEKVDVICSNPPYSMLDKVIEKSIALKPRVISYLIGVNNLTCRRIEMLEKAGYVMTQMHMCKVFKWFGMSFIVQFEKKKSADEKGVVGYDRIVWK